MPETHARLNFYFFPSPHGTDWSSPASLALSALKNRFSFLPRPLHSLGHVNIEGVDQNGDRQFLTGMVTKNVSDQLRLVLMEHFGLGVLFHSFPGHLESPDEIESQFSARFKTDKISLLSLKVRPKAIELASDYLKEFIDHLGYHSYGLVNRPLHLEGSGCSAFAASFLEVLGFDFEPFRKNWSRTIRIHDDHLGGHHSLKSHQKVTFLKLVTEAKRWANADEPHRELFFWDPDLMHNWLLQSWDAVRSGQFPFPGLDHRAYQMGKAKALEIDFSHHVPKSKVAPTHFATEKKDPTHVHFAHLELAKEKKDHHLTKQFSHRGKKAKHHL